jgi:hypothetical protein
MGKSTTSAALLTIILVFGSLSVEAKETIASLTDNPSLTIGRTQHLTADRFDASGNHHASSANGPLDVVFLLSSGLVGYLLLRRANNT